MSKQIQPTTRAHECEFVLSLGQFIASSVTDEHWEDILPAQIDAWKAAEVILNKNSFIFENQAVEISAKWSPVVGRLRRGQEVYRELAHVAGMLEVNQVLEKFPRSSVSVPIRFVGIEGKNSIQTRNIAERVLGLFLHDVFLIMNLACPSSCNFYQVRLSSPMLLSNTSFEISIVESLGGKWPTIRFIDVAKVAKWFFGIRAGQNLVPKSRIERALFAMLHIAREDVSPAAIIWIFYALESLYDTRTGENFRTLTTRIELLLKPSTAQARFLKKNLRALYDMRSAFVHGGLEVIHPVHDNGLDQSVDLVYSRVMDAVSFGFGLILASLQEMILLDCSEPCFQEIFMGQRPAERG